MTQKFTVGSCFSGIGGLELGLEWTGRFETCWQIENDQYASAVLAKHWPQVKRYGDIRTATNLEPVDVVCGGFPCQDVSLAGSRAGLGGGRSTLWGEMFRIICEVEPKWVVAENVPGLLSSDDGRFFGNILRDLASIGFYAEWGVLSAAGVGAPHIRRRVFILANSSGKQNRRLQPGGLQPDSRAGSHVANAKGSGRAERNKNARGRAEREGTQEERARPPDNGRWAPEPDVGRVAHGVPSRVDRLRCLGNAVVPQVAKRIGEMILQAEQSQ